MSRRFITKSGCILPEVSWLFTAAIYHQIRMCYPRFRVSLAPPFTTKLGCLLHEVFWLFGAAIYHRIQAFYSKIPGFLAPQFITKFGCVLPEFSWFFGSNSKTFSATGNLYWIWSRFKVDLPDFMALWRRQQLAQIQRHFSPKFHGFKVVFDLRILPEVPELFVRIFLQ